MSWNERHQRELADKKRESRSRIVWAIATFLGGAIVGAITTLYVSQWFVALLPGPNAVMEVRVLRPNVGSGLGCTYYELSLRSDTPLTNSPKQLEYVYFKILFPNQTTVTDFKASYGEDVLRTTDNHPFRITSFPIGRDSNGECDVVLPPTEAKLGNEAETTIEGHMVSGHVAKLPAERAYLDGAVATKHSGPDADSDPKIFEGEYEYVVLGQLVRKPLKFDWEGMTTTTVPSR
jgi:hypothetical protein